MSPNPSMASSNIIQANRLLLLLFLVVLPILPAQDLESPPTLHQALDELDALFPKLESIESSYMLDGGTRSLIFEDSKGKSFSLCLDNSNVTFLVQYENAEFDIEDTMRQRLLYLHAKHPAQKESIPVPFKGPEEEEIKTKLRQFIEFNPQFSKSIEVFISEMESERLKEIEYQAPDEIDLNSNPPGDLDNITPTIPKPDIPTDLDFTTTP